jgi:hypothetical protein
MQRRDQSADKAEPANETREVTPASRADAGRVSPLQKYSRANGVHRRERSQRDHDPGIECPSGDFFMAFDAVGVGNTRQRQASAYRQNYRSHPLSTIAAIPCIARAKVKTRAARALVALMKYIVLLGRSVSAMGRFPEHHDTIAVTPAMVAAVKDAIAESFTWARQSR